MLQLKKYHFYLDRAGRLVQIITDKIKPFDLYIALADPRDPRSGNLYYVRSDGVTEDMSDDSLDLDADVTCSRCGGRGKFLTRTGPDEACIQACFDCGAKGHRKLK